MSDALRIRFRGKNLAKLLFLIPRHNKRVNTGACAYSFYLYTEGGGDNPFFFFLIAHAEGSAVRAAYNHAERLEERRKMVQGWAD
jgi:ABC-type spermidine/putrescine transport system permease subunit II